MDPNDLEVSKWTRKYFRFAAPIQIDGFRIGQPAEDLGDGVPRTCRLPLSA